MCNLCYNRQFDQRETAHGGPPDEHTLWLWKDADWRKWEQDDRWQWEANARKTWAERLFRQHVQRELDRIAAQKQQEQQRLVCGALFRSAWVTSAGSILLAASNVCHLCVMTSYL